jgi:Iron-containing redox enzyme
MNMDTSSKRLRAKLDMAYPVLSAHAEQIWSSPSICELYPVYLHTMHMIVRSAVPLMECALEQAHLRGFSDKVAIGLASYLIQHIKEEAGHDKWLLEDLETIGFDSEDILKQIPSPQVATLVGAQYYWVHHHHPIALLGHITAIESYHPPTGFSKRLHELTGYPKEAFRTISQHEILDVHHKYELYQMIDELPLEPEHEKMMGISALHTIQAQIDVLIKIYGNSA